MLHYLELSLVKSNKRFASKILNNFSLMDAGRKILSLFTWKHGQYFSFEIMFYFKTNKSSCHISVKSVICSSYWLVLIAWNHSNLVGCKHENQVKSLNTRKDQLLQNFNLRFSKHSCGWNKTFFMNPWMLGIINNIIVFLLIISCRSDSLQNFLTF